MRILAYILATIFLVLEMIVSGLFIYDPSLISRVGISFTEIGKWWLIEGFFSGFIIKALGLYGIYTKRIALITPALLLASATCISKLVGLAVIATFSLHTLGALIAVLILFIGAASMLYIIWDINKSRSIEK